MESANFTIHPGTHAACLLVSAALWVGIIEITARLLGH